MRIHRKNVILNTLTLFAVAATAVVTLAAIRGDKQNPASCSQQDAADINQKKLPTKDREGADFDSQFPVADYERQVAVEEDKRKEREKKSKRYDQFGLVSRQPSNIEEAVFDSRWQESIAALPTKQSAVIVIGKVQKVEAHLSNNKSGVYTEFIIHVDDVLKEDGSGRLSAGSTISADRPGGFVRYPSGYKLLYRIFGMNIPRVGRRYVLFLGSLEESQNYPVITGYELSLSGVFPLDVGSRFDAYKGMDEAAFLKAVRDAIEPPSTTESN